MSAAADPTTHETPVGIVAVVLSVIMMVVNAAILASRRFAARRRIPPRG